MMKLEFNQSIMLNSITILLLLVCFANANLLGGKNVVNPKKLKSDENLKEMFSEAVNQYNKLTNNAFSYAPYQVHSIIKQVVAGMLYEFDVTLLGTNCNNEPNNKAKQILLECGINENLTPKRALLQIVSTPWLNPQLSSKVLSEVEDHDLKLHDQLFVVGFANGESVSGLNFQKFKNTFNKAYVNEEEELVRYKLFHSNFKRALLMKFLDKGSAEYGVTQFSDLTEEEFSETYLSSHWDLTKIPKTVSQVPMDYQAPQAIDWRTLGAVTDVKNQGQCGSCWAFSTTGNIEGQWFIKTKHLISLSEQQLVDCDTLDSGCNGGLPLNAYKAIQQIGGLESEDDYPYEAKGGSCKFSKSKIEVFINGSTTIPSLEATMSNWCALNGPISIGINAFAMQFYRGGISNPFSIFCNPNHLDHGVLIVGYNITTAGEPYWIIKNSWGASWGENGYYLVYRGSGACGLNKMPTSAVITPN